MSGAGAGAGAGAEAGAGLRCLADVWRNDPEAWAAFRASLVRDERGAINYGGWGDCDSRGWFNDRVPSTDKTVRKLRAGWRTGPSSNAGSPPSDQIALYPTGGAERIWADGLGLDPDRVVAVEAKYIKDISHSAYNPTGRAYPPPEWSLTTPRHCSVAWG